MLPDSFGSSSPTPRGSESTALAAVAVFGAIIASFLPGLIIALVKKDDPFVAYHAWGSCFFSLITTVIAIVSIITIIGPLVVGLATLVILILAGVKAVQGQTYKWPIVDGWARKAAGIN